MDGWILFDANASPVSTAAATAFHGVWDSAGLVPRARTAIGQRSVAVNGPRTWNSLPADLRTPDTTLCSFKRHLKTHLFQQ